MNLIMRKLSVLFFIMLFLGTCFNLEAKSLTLKLNLRADYDEDLKDVGDFYSTDQNLIIDFTNKYIILENLKSGSSLKFNNVRLKESKDNTCSIYNATLEGVDADIVLVYSDDYLFFSIYPYRVFTSEAITLDEFKCIINNLK